MHDNENGKLFTPTEAKQLRENIIRGWILPGLEKRFEKYAALRSAALLVAQYWCDEADDAVHKRLFFSVLETPDYKTALECGYGEHDPVNLPDLPPDSEILFDKDCGWISWDDNGMAIPAFAAFCREESHQELNTEEAYSLFAIFRKTSEGFDIEYCGEMVRPWLDGVRPEFFLEIDPDEVSKIKAEYLEPLDA